MDQYRKYRLKIKTQIMQHYGNKCNCCGEDTFEFLSIDHINDDGSKHRKEISPKYHHHIPNTVIYRWIIKNNYPDDFQILCFNCNTAKHYHKICPHKKILNSISSLRTT